MHILQIFRNRLKLILCVSLSLMLLMIFWPQRVELVTVNLSLPDYPSAQDVSQIVSTKGAYVCDGGGARSDSHVRVTSFVTPDPPEVVKQFYYSNLVEQGLYAQSPGGDAYFTTFYAVDREAHFLRSGSAVILFTASGYNRTVVKVREYRYQYHTSCHPGVRYDDPWDL